MQARFALKYISGAIKLPSKTQMIFDMQTQAQIHWNKGYSKNKTHYLGWEQREYCNQISETAEIKNMPEVLLSVFEDHLETVKREPYTFRKYRYLIVDEKTFEKMLDYQDKKSDQTY